MTIDYLAHLRTESARFVDVLRDLAPSVRVPTCPDWDAADLLWHLTEVQMFWGAIVRDRLDDPRLSDSAKAPRAASYPGLVDQFRAANATLLDALGTTGDDVAVWTWTRDHSVGFIRRRVAQETLVHRFDADATAGLTGDADPVLATDGVDEAMRWFHGGCPVWASFTADGPAGTLRTTDTGQAWSIRVGTVGGTRPNGDAVEAEPAFDLLDAPAGDASFEIAAPARDLLAWLWNRPTIAPVDRAGASDDLARVDAVVASGVE